MKKKLRLKKSVKEKLFNATIYVLLYAVVIVGVLSISHQNNSQKITDSVAVNQLNK